MQVTETESVDLRGIEVPVESAESAGTKIEDQREGAALVGRPHQIRRRRGVWTGDRSTAADNCEVHARPQTNCSTSTTRSPIRRRPAASESRMRPWRTLPRWKPD